MEDVASRAGVSVGTLYNYFEDRQALLSALLDGRRQELVVRLDAALDEGKGTPYPAQLERFVGTFLDHFDTHRRFFAIVMQGDRPAGAKEASVVTAPSTATMRLITERFEKVVRRGQREHAVRSGDPALLATLLVGMARAVLLRSLARGDEAPTAPLAKSIADVFLHGAAS